MRFSCWSGLAWCLLLASTTTAYADENKGRSTALSDAELSLQSAERRIARVESLNVEAIERGAELDVVTESLKEAARELKLAQQPKKGTPAPAEKVRALRARLADAQDDFRLRSAEVWSGPLAFGGEELKPVWVYLDPKVESRLDARVASVMSDLRAIESPKKKDTARAALKELTLDARGGRSPHFRVASRAMEAGFDGEGSLKKACARVSKDSLVWRRRTLEAVFRRGLALSNPRLLGLGEEGEEGMAGTVESTVNRDLAAIEGMKACGNKLGVEAPPGAPALSHQVVAARLEAFEVHEEARSGPGKLDGNLRKATAASVGKTKADLASRMARADAAYERSRAAGADGKSLEAARVEYQAVVTSGQRLLPQVRSLREVESAELEALQGQQRLVERMEAALAKARRGAGELRTLVNAHLRALTSSKAGALPLPALEAKANAALAEADVKLLTKMSQSLKQTFAGNVQRLAVGSLSEQAKRRATNQKADAKLHADVTKAQGALADLERELARLRAPSPPTKSATSVPVAGCDLRRVDWKNFAFEGFQLSEGSASEEVNESAHVTYALVDVSYGDVSGDNTVEALVTISTSTMGVGPATTSLELLPYRISKKCAPVRVRVAADKPMLDDPYVSEVKTSYFGGAFRVSDGVQVREWKMKGDELRLVNSFVPGD